VFRIVPAYKNQWDHADEADFTRAVIAGKRPRRVGGGGPGGKPRAGSVACEMLALLSEAWDGDEGVRPGIEEFLRRVGEISAKQRGAE
jgi:hypothetical protein